ncbi:Ribosomal protein YMR-31, mitochondrial [Moelleriella libera RCEF 2490]|uniref:Ribosomal protein YMR-31, mitochondrial n=1 Tax=Moelleriella libera RCEF 2490 TaxID=1081109 RepID=A0A166VIE8_9HYPO|nr:Ribosomal protein YMR-31, mitochondrial [Moelleriella libera RCEF 2490]
MFASRALRRAAAHAERTPLIKFIGPRSIPSSVDHTPKPHPASPSGKLPESFSAYGQSDAATRHNSFSSYRDHAQQHGPLQKTIRNVEAGIGGSSGSQLGPIEPPAGVLFDMSELPARFRRTPIDLAEIEAVESGGAALVG